MRIIVYQPYENVLQRALLRIEILETNAKVAHFAQERRHACPLRLRIEFIDEFMPITSQSKLPVLKPFGQLRKRLGQIECQGFAAEFFHQRIRSFDDDQLFRPK